MTDLQTPAATAGVPASGGPAGSVADAPAPGRRALAWLGLVVLVGSAVVGSNLFSVRDRLVGSALPSPVPAASSRLAAPTGGGVRGKPTQLRSSPWWQDVTVLEGTGATAPPPFAIVGDAIQWRARWTCASGRLRVRTPGQGEPLVDAACTNGGAGFSSQTGPTHLEVEADGPWRLEIAQRIDTPLVEAPRPAMTAPGATVVATGSFHKVDRSGAGKVTIYSQADGRYSVRLEDFFVSPSSHLQLRLSTARSGRRSADFVAARSQLLTVLDVTAGSVNLSAPVGVDPADFRSVVIWCAPVSSAYAAADLGPAA